MEDQDALYQQLLAQLHLKRTATKTPEAQALETALAADPENLSLKMQLAVRYSQENLTKEALEAMSIVSVECESRSMFPEITNPTAAGFGPTRKCSPSSLNSNVAAENTRFATMSVGTLPDQRCGDVDCRRMPRRSLATP